MGIDIDQQGYAYMANAANALAKSMMAQYGLTIGGQPSPWGQAVDEQFNISQGNLATASQEKEAYEARKAANKARPLKIATSLLGDVGKAAVKTLGPGGADNGVGTKGTKSKPKIVGYNPDGSPMYADEELG